MPGNPESTVYIGNLDEKVDEKVLYEIMVQAGPLVDVYLPRDKETKRHKGYGFAEFSSEKSAHYAVSLFSGLVSLYKRSLRFSISGQDKQTSAQDKFAQLQEGRTDMISSPLETSSYFQRNHPSLQSPPISYPLSSVNNGYSGPILAGQRLNFSPLAPAHNYNARMVSLGQVGLRTQFPSRDYPYAHPSY